MARARIASSIECYAHRVLGFAWRGKPLKLAVGLIPRLQELTGDLPRNYDRVEVIRSPFVETSLAAH
jgi:hypothetical protein